MRAYEEREDYATRKANRVPVTFSERQWEKQNPGYELRAVASWEALTPGQKVWRGYEGEEPSTFASLEPSASWGFNVTEDDEPNRLAGLPARRRIHSTRWDARFSRVIVKVA